MSDEIQEKTKENKTRKIQEGSEQSLSNLRKWAEKIEDKSVRDALLSDLVKLTDTSEKVITNSIIDAVTLGYSHISMHLDIKIETGKLNMNIVTACVHESSSIVVGKDRGE